MTDKHFVIATAGHVDHGKSALVKALTGTDPDRLPEEKLRGITIDLGFAELNLNGRSGEKIHVAIVDVPGHDNFVRNMIAGVGSIDLALIVVAADDGWMPQTEEHLQILSYLGVKRAVVALTKTDLATLDSAQVRDQLQNTSFATAPIISTSIRTGDGIEDLQRALGDELTQLPPVRDINKPRLFVDRAFSLHGIGPVVTGTLIGGKFSRGQIVRIQPRNLEARIRTIQSHGRETEEAQPATRTALNLAGVGVGSQNSGLRRGDVVTETDLGSPSRTLEAKIDRSPRLKSNTPAGRAIKNRSFLYVHHGTSRVSAKIVLFDHETLGCGETGLAELRLESPIFALIGDRFVLRDPSERHTIAGGFVLNVLPDEQVDRQGERSPALSARAAAPNDCAVYVATELARAGFVERANLLRQSIFSADEIAGALAHLKEKGAIILSGDIAADRDYWGGLLMRATRAIDQFHQRHPEQRGIGLSELRATLGLPSDVAFSALLPDLSGFIRIEDKIARSSHRSALPASLQATAEVIIATLSAKPFDPPARKELAQNRDQDQALRFLIERGEVIEINQDVVLSRDAATRMQKMVIDFITINTRATASQLRQAIGTSRRIVIPYLEYLDRRAITQRLGDSRQLRQTKSEAVASK